MANENLFSAEQFYTGSFITNQFQPSFTAPLADERLAILVEIEPKPDFGVFVLARQQFANFFDLARIHYFYVDGGGTLTRSDGDPPSNTDFDKRYLTSSPVPNYLVFTDENGDFRYVTVNESTLALQSSGTRPAQFSTAQAHFCGPFLETVASNGQSIYRITVDSANTISVTLHATELKRVLTARLSHGHHSPIDETDTLWSPALVSLGDMRTSIPQAAGGFAGIATPSFSEFQIQLADDEFLYLAEQGWDAREITIRAGLTTAPISDYTVIFRGLAAKVEASLNTLTITMRDGALMFNKSFQENVYGGGGGYDGSTQLEGVVKPIGYGQSLAAPAVLVDESINLYQVHDGPIHAIYEVYTGASLLNDGGDLLGLADLTVWSPTAGDVSAGRYRTDVANGMFRLAAPPTAPITVDFGGSTSVPEFNYSIGNVIQAIIADKLPEVTLDSNAMSAFIARWPQTLGFLYITSETTIGQVLRDLVEPMGAVIVLTRLNELKVMMLERSDARASIQSDNMVESAVSPKRREPPIPALTYRVGGKKLIQLNETDILSNATADDKQRHIGPVSHVSYSPWVSDSKRYDSAGNIEKVVNFLSANARRNVLYSMVHRDYFLQSLYEVTVIGFLYQFELGDTVLIEIPELGINQPKTGIIVGIAEKSPTRNTEDLTDLLIWTH